MFRKILILASIIPLIGSPPTLATAIYVSGDQSGTWTADTVIVTAEVRVPPGASLTVLPGVEVLFSVYCKLTVANGATLRAVGTAADSIRFDVLLPNTAWHGVRFMSASDSSRLEYCHLTQGHATGGGEDGRGGAIYCSGSSPTISHNTLVGNSADWGGGIYCITCSPIIHGNCISRNSASIGGGILCSNNSSPHISENTISENTTNMDGGGIYCMYNSNATISGNMISGNTTSSWYGGGICCFQSSPNITDNIIRDNSAPFGGGGIYFYYASNAIVSGNIIFGNSGGEGGGINCEEAGSGLQITGNTFSGNSGYGSAIFVGPNSAIHNCVLWGDLGLEIGWHTPFPVVSYTDVQGMDFGGTNLMIDPLYVNAAQLDYRLQWGSPCIDGGDPNSIYNDPDGTRADMGACYFDQSLPVRILLTPYDTPIQIPASGGSFQYAIQATNIETSTLQVPIWCDATLPSGAGTVPLLGPVTISLASGQTLSRLRTQSVPASAPAGMYHYNAYAVAASDTSEDSFSFVKLGSGVWGLGSDGWTNTGEEFDLAGVKANGRAPKSGSGATPTLEVTPNPFNPTAVASFELRVSSYVSLRISDTAGRLVATLVDGWRDAGDHQITFDGSRLPSGVYLVRMQAGDFNQVRKVVLMK